MLCCPACPDEPDLKLASDGIAGEAVITGKLICTRCDRNYPIREGVPRLLIGQESAEVKAAFTEQWRLRYGGRFEQESRVFWLENSESVRYLSENLLAKIEPGDWILDGGCGSGEKSRELAKLHPQAQIVAMDISETLPELAQRARDLANLHIVQGDVSHPPLKSGRFAHLVSIGVLHHTPDTRKAFFALAPRLKASGRLVVWLYPHPSESPPFQKFYYAFRDKLFLGRGHRLSGSARLNLLRLLCLPVFLLMPVFLLSKAIQKRFYRHLSLADLYHGLVFMLYDDLAPLYQHRHSRLEVRNWYLEAGFAKVSEPQLGLYVGESRRGERGNVGGMTASGWGIRI
ncbi:MAG TPA: methyltransferase domain-containing protein [Candidatus Obscuribacterales bacterium]